MQLSTEREIEQRFDVGCWLWSERETNLDVLARGTTYDDDNEDGVSIRSHKHISKPHYLIQDTRLLPNRNLLCIVCATRENIILLPICTTNTHEINIHSLKGCFKVNIVRTHILINFI